jgi:phosphoadenosine phosphosulfate reductase
MDARERESFLAYTELPQFQRKVDRALATIREALLIGSAYVSVSWGKDSVVMLHLCQQIQPDILAVFLGHSEQDLISNFSDTEKRYCEKHKTNYQPIYLSQIQEKTYDPVRLKTVLSKIDKPLAFIGMRAEESINRKRSISRYGLIHQYKSLNYRACPIAYFNWQDIWAYTIKYDLPYLEAYDLIPRSSPQSRTSLHFGRSANSSLGANRWEQFKAICPKFVEHVRNNYDNIDWL